MVSASSASSCEQRSKSLSKDVETMTEATFLMLVLSSMIPSFSRKELAPDWDWVLDPLRHGWRSGSHGCGLSKTQSQSGAGVFEDEMRGFIRVLSSLPI